MECSSVYCDNDDSRVTMLAANHRKARKQHKCHECREVIATGETYLEERYAWEGKIDIHKTCCDCESIRKEMFHSGWNYGFLIEMLGEHVKDSGGDISESRLAALTPGARAVLCEMIEEYWYDTDEDNYDE